MVRWPSSSSFFTGSGDGGASADGDNDDDNGTPSDGSDNAASSSSPHSSVRSGSPKSTPVQVARGLHDFLRQVGGSEYDKTSMLADFAIGLGVLIDHKEKQRRANFASDLARLMRERTVLSAEEILRLQHYARLAHGSYCTSERELFERTSLYEGTVKRARWSSTQDRPAYFVAVDDVYCAVVVSIRGTDTIYDVFTDLSLQPAPFIGGHAHSGMVRSALSLYDEVRDTLRSLRRQYPDHELVFTGHSLGGGVASLLTLKMYLEDAPGGRDGGSGGRSDGGGEDAADSKRRSGWLGLGNGGSLFASSSPERAGGAGRSALSSRMRRSGDWTQPRAYTFATPACVSADLAERAARHQGLQQALTSVVLGDDLVPRACAASIDRVVRELAAFDWPQHMTKDVVSMVSETRLAQWSREYLRFSVDRQRVGHFMREVSNMLGKSSATRNGGGGGGGGGSALANGVSAGGAGAGAGVSTSIAASTRMSKLASVASAASGILSAYNKYMDSKEKHQQRLKEQQQQQQQGEGTRVRQRRSPPATKTSTAMATRSEQEQKLPQYLLPGGRLLHLVAVPEMAVSGGADARAGLAANGASAAGVAAKLAGDGEQGRSVQARSSRRDRRRRDGDDRAGASKAAAGGDGDEAEGEQEAEAAIEERKADSDAERSGDQSRDEQAKRVLVRVARSEEFKDIVLSRDCIGDHLMRNIRRALSLSECS